MATTPWEIADRFTQYLGNKRLQESRLGAAHEENVYRQGAAADRATTAYGRALTRDEINNQNAIERLGVSSANASARADAQRRFQHNENYLTHVKYKTEAFNEMMKGIGGGTDALADPSAAPPPGVDPTTTGSTGGGGGGGATDESGRVTPQSAYAYLTGQGMPPMVAAGIVGNIDVETGWDQSVFTGQRMGDSGTAGYSGQWRGPRLQHLYEFSQSRGHSAPTAEDQLDFYYEEAQSGRDAGARQAFEAASQAQTPEEAAHAFMEHYERPNPKFANPNRRMSAARAIYGGGGAAAPATQQRRYGMSAAPTADDLPDGDMSMYEDPEDDPAMQELLAQEEDDAATEAEFVAPEDTAWGDEDFAANGVDPVTTMSVPDDMDVVGQGYYSDTGVQLMPETMRTRLLPVAGGTPDAANKYLIMKPKMGDPAGAAPVQTVPTGQRTRRNEQGQLEVNIDGTWQPTGG